MRAHDANFRLLLSVNHVDRVLRDHGAKALER